MGLPGSHLLLARGKDSGSEAKLFALPRAGRERLGSRGRQTGGVKEAPRWVATAAGARAGQLSCGGLGAASCRKAPPQVNWGLARVTATCGEVA